MNKSQIIENAQSFAAQGKVEKAITEWKKLLSETPQDGNIYNTIADLYLRNNDTASAIDTCLKAAAVYKEAGFELKGVAVLKKILKIDPERIDIYERLADINVERGLTGSAVSAYQETAKLYLQRSNFKAAICVYRKLASFAPEDPEIPLAIARLYQKQEQNREAILAYEQAEMIYESKKMVSEARQVVEEIVKINPNYLKHLATKEVSVAELDKTVAPKEVALPSPSVEERPESHLKTQEENKEVDMHSFGGRESEFYREIEPYKMTENALPPPVATPTPAPVVQQAPTYQAMSPPQVLPQRRDPVLQDPVAALSSSMTSQRVDLPVGFSPKEIPSIGSSFVPGEQRAGIRAGKIETRPPRKETPNISEVIFQAHLAEVDVYLRYGLNQNAIEKLLLARELDPTREEPYLRLREIYLKEGQGDKAEQISRALINLYEQKNDLEKRDALFRKLYEKGTKEGGSEQTAPLASFGSFASPQASKASDPTANPWPSFSDQGTAALAPLTEPNTNTLPQDHIDANDWFGRSVSAPDLEGETGRGDEEYIDLGSVMAEDLNALSGASLVTPTPQSKGAVEGNLDDGVVNETKRQAYVETCYHLGVAHKENGSYEKAIRELEQALSVSGGSRFREVLLLLSACYSESGYISQAIEVLQGGMNDPRCDEGSRLFIQYELASYFEQLGDREKSFALYKEVYRIAPHFKDVAGKVKEIPYRKPTQEVGRANERFIGQEGVEMGGEDTARHGLYLGGRPKEKRRVSYI